MKSKDEDRGDLLKIPEVAKKLNVSVSKTRRLLAQGAIRFARIGAAIRVRPEDLESYIESRATGPKK